MSITLTQLRSFVAVVRTGSVTAAADELIVTQPSVSAAVAGLARELGMPLLERDGRGVRPTAAGRAFAPYATDVIGLLEKGRRASTEAASTSGRKLRIAAVTTAAESFVPALMHAFAADREGIGLTLQVGNRDQVVAMVLDHEADVAFTGRPPRSDRIEAFALWPNDLVLIAAPNDPLAGQSHVRSADLTGRHWLLREPGSGTRAANESFLATTGLDISSLTVGSNGAIKQAVLAGLGVSFVSRDSVAAELEAGQLSTIGVEPAPTSPGWHLVRSRVGPPRPVADEFVAFVHDARIVRTL